LYLPVLRAFLDRHHLPPKADPFIERVLAQIGSGCESLNAALSAEELMISPRGHVILRDDPSEEAPLLGGGGHIHASRPRR
jgi:hypothetical protein